MGGRVGERIRLYRAISQLPPEEMAVNVATYRAQGYTRFQLKVGGDPDLDIQRIRQAREILQPSDRLLVDVS
jgi:L-alanine-DL-glutamate epimerase-like enolase superfamily enzyme